MKRRNIGDFLYEDNKVWLIIQNACWDDLNVGETEKMFTLRKMRPVSKCGTRRTVFVLGFLKQKDPDV